MLSELHMLREHSLQHISNYASDFCLSGLTIGPAAAEIQQAVKPLSRLGPLSQPGRYVAGKPAQCKGHPRFKAY